LLTNRCDRLFKIIDVLFHGDDAREKKMIIFYGKAIVFSLYVCIFAP